jgi:hypothetical protein
MWRTKQHLKDFGKKSKIKEGLEGQYEYCVSQKNKTWNKLNTWWSQNEKK